MRKKYFLVVKDNLLDFESEVNRMIEEGYNLYGDIITIKDNHSESGFIFVHSMFCVD